MSVTEAMEADEIFTTGTAVVVSAVGSLTHRVSAPCRRLLWNALRFFAVERFEVVVLAFRAAKGHQSCSSLGACALFSFPWYLVGLWCFWFCFPYGWGSCLLCVAIEVSASWVCIYITPKPFERLGTVLCTAALAWRLALEASHGLSCTIIWWISWLCRGRKSSLGSQASPQRQRCASMRH